MLMEERTARALRQILPFWKGKTLKERVLGQLPEDTPRARKALLFNLAMPEDSGPGHVLMDYPGYEEKGFAGILRDREERSATLGLGSPSDFDKHLLWRAVVTLGESVNAFARRYAAEARRLAPLRHGPVPRAAPEEAIGPELAREPPTRRS